MCSLHSGIYRQAGHETKIRQLLNECLDDPFQTSLSIDHYSEHDVASALKRFLRQLDPPLLGTRQQYDAWLRSTVDRTMTSEQLIQYYRALLKDLRQHYPIHYSTLRHMLIHIHSVAMLSDRNGMTLSNLVSTFAPCLVSQAMPTPIDLKHHHVRLNRNLSSGTADIKRASEDDASVINDSSDSSQTSSPNKLRRNQSLRSEILSSSQARTHRLFLATQPTTTTTAAMPQSSQFPLSSSYMHAAPSIEADLEIMSHLCKYFQELFDISNEEIAYEEACVQTMVFVHDNPYQARQIDGTIVSVYFESRADEFNGYAMKIIEQETTADMIVDKLLRQVEKPDCSFWSVFEVIIDQNLERPMYCCETITEVLDRFGRSLSPELNRQATFVVKLNYLQLEKERLQQRQVRMALESVQCEYFELASKSWVPCYWLFERALVSGSVMRSAREESSVPANL